MLIQTNALLLPFVQYVYILVLHLAHRIVVVWVSVFKWRCYTYHNTVRNVIAVQWTHTIGSLMTANHGGEK